MYSSLVGVTMEVTYAEIGAYVMEKLKTQFPGRDFIIDDVEDDDRGLYFTYKFVTEEEQRALIDVGDTVDADFDTAEDGLSPVHPEDGEETAGPGMDDTPGGQFTV